MPRCREYWEKRKEKIDRQTDSLPLALSSALPKLKPTDKHHDRPYYILASRWSFVRSGGGGVYI
eukprot:scaffold1985_cov82-Skeletonema_marinoi.AAC.6